jgi:hypothetical protein
MTEESSCGTGYTGETDASAASRADACPMKRAAQAQVDMYEGEQIG